MATDAQLVTPGKANTTAPAVPIMIIFMMTYKTSNLGQTDLVLVCVGLQSSIIRSVHAINQLINQSLHLSTDTIYVILIYCT